MSATEQWRMIVGHPSYEVSNAGRVRSVAREHLMASRWGGTVRRRWHSRELRPWMVGKGYLAVSLGAGSRGYVHRFVAEAFCPRPSSGNEVNHRHGDKSDNRASNLEWVTRSENMQHSTRVLNNRAGQFTRRGADA